MSSLSYLKWRDSSQTAHLRWEKVHNTISTPILWWTNIVLAPYDERSSRLHVRRVREIIGMSFLYSSVSPSVFSFYNLPEEEEPKVGS